MKYINKSASPTLFQNYVDNNRVRNASRTGVNIWKIFKGNTEVKIDLHQSLLKEQGFICAYCGKKIGKESTDTFSVEHFEVKSNQPNLTLMYSNLLGCCKMSQPQIVKLEDVKCSPKTFRNIAEELAIDITDFRDKKEFGDDDDLELLGAKIMFNRGIPVHCDDGKEDRLRKIGWQEQTETVEDYVINPTKSVDCESYFEYITDDTGIFCEIKAKENLPITQRAKNTIYVFELNTEYLRKARTDAVKRVQTLRNSQKLGSDSEDILNEIYSLDSDGKLTPFCFVTAYFLV